MDHVVFELVRECQVIAGHFGTIEPHLLIAEIRELVIHVPQFVSRSDQLIITEVLDQMLGRFVRLTSLQEQPHIAAGFVGLATMRPTLSRWRSEWLRVANSCAAAVDARSRPVADSPDVRVTRMVRFIDRSYNDPHLSVRAVADAANL